MAELIKTAEGQLLIKGVLNYASVPGIQMAAEKLLPELSAIIVDLQHVEYSNSAGLALLLAWRRYGELNQKSFQVKSVSRQLLAIAKVTGVDKILNL